MYTIQPHGRWMPVLYVWAGGFLKYTARSWDEAEGWIRGQGGVVPERPEWARA